MKLIDKDAVVAEIEGIEYETNYEPFTDEVLGKRKVCKDIKEFLATLEVKYVDLDREIKEEYLKRRCYGGRDNMLVILNEPQFNKIAKHFFELGLKAQKEK